MLAPFDYASMIFAVLDRLGCCSAKPDYLRSLIGAGHGSLRAVAADHLAGTPMGLDRFKSKGEQDLRQGTPSCTHAKIACQDCKSGAKALTLLGVESQVS